VLLRRRQATLALLAAAVVFRLGHRRWEERHPLGLVDIGDDVVARQHTAPADEAK
jgi:hypothetical protein